MFTSWAFGSILISALVAESPACASPVQLQKRDKPPSVSQGGNLYRCYNRGDETSGQLPPQSAFTKSGDFNPKGYLGFYMWTDIEDAKDWCEAGDYDYLGTFDWYPPQDVPFPIKSFPDGDEMESNAGQDELGKWQRLVSASYNDAIHEPYTGPDAKYKVIEGPVSHGYHGNYYPNVELYQVCFTDEATVQGMYRSSVIPVSSFGGQKVRRSERTQRIDAIRQMMAARNQTSA